MSIPDVGSRGNPLGRARKRPGRHAQPPGSWPVSASKASRVWCSEHFLYDFKGGALRAPPAARTAGARCARVLARRPHTTSRRRRGRATDSPTEAPRRPFTPAPDRPAPPRRRGSAPCRRRPLTAAATSATPLPGTPNDTQARKTMRPSAPKTVAPGVGRGRDRTSGGLGSTIENATPPGSRRPTGRIARAVIRDCAAQHPYRLVEIARLGTSAGFTLLGTRGMRQFDRRAAGCPCQLAAEACSGASVVLRRWPDCMYLLTPFTCFPGCNHVARCARIGVGRYHANSFAC